MHQGRLVEEAKLQRAKLDQEKKSLLLIKTTSNTRKKENAYKEIVKSMKGSNLPIVNILVLFSTAALKLSYQYLGGQISKLQNFIAMLQTRDIRYQNIMWSCCKKIDNVEKISKLEESLKDIGEMADV